MKYSNNCYFKVFLLCFRQHPIKIWVLPFLLLVSVIQIMILALMHVDARILIPIVLMDFQC